MNSSNQASKTATNSILTPWLDQPMVIILDQITGWTLYYPPKKWSSVRKMRYVTRAATLFTFLFINHPFKYLSLIPRAMGCQQRLSASRSRGEGTAKVSRKYRSRLRKLGELRSSPLNWTSTMYCIAKNWDNDIQIMVRSAALRKDQNPSLSRSTIKCRAFLLKLWPWKSAYTSPPMEEVYKTT